MLKLKKKASITGYYNKMHHQPEINGANARQWLCRKCIRNVYISHWLRYKAWY